MTTGVFSAEVVRRSCKHKLLTFEQKLDQIRESKKLGGMDTIEAACWLDVVDKKIERVRKIALMAEMLDTIELDPDDCWLLFSD